MDIFYNKQKKLDRKFLKYMLITLCVYLFIERNNDTPEQKNKLLKTF